MGFLEKVKAVNELQASAQIELWYPALCDAGLGDVMPSTVFWEMPAWFIPMIVEYNLSCPMIMAAVKSAEEEVSQVVYGAFGGKSVFFKTSTFSNKHSRETLEYTYFDDIVYLVYEGVLLSVITDTTSPLTIAFRQMLSIEGEELLDGSVLPVGVERRFFVSAMVEDKVLKELPYWPQEAFPNQDQEYVEGYLAKLNSVRSPEWVHEQSLVAGRALTKKWPSITEWSIDWAMDYKGQWWLIDVAPASQSWGWDDAYASV